MPMSSAEKNRRHWAKLTPEQRSDVNRSNYSRTRQRVTGWTPEDVDRAWRLQGGCCAICTRDMLRKGRTVDAMNADHCHTSGVKRALLCRVCNLSLGYYEKHQREYIRIDVYENYLHRFV